MIVRSSNSAGSEVVFNAAATTEITAAHMPGSDYGVVCYIATGLHCKALSRSGTSLTPGNAAQIQASANSPAEPSIAAQDSSNAVVCYEASNQGGCSVITRSGSSLSTGTQFTYSSSQVAAVSVAYLSETKSIVCFRDQNNNDYGEQAELALWHENLVQVPVLPWLEVQPV